MRLSGWKRLWVFVAILYFIPVALITFSALPKENQIYSDWYFVLYYQAQDMKVVPDDKSSVEFANDNGNPSYKDSINLIEDKVNKQYSSNSDPTTGYTAYYIYKVQSIRSRYELQLQNLQHDQLVGLFVGFLCWIIPLICLYVFGAGVGWVYSGFKSHK